MVAGCARSTDQVGATCAAVLHGNYNARAAQAAGVQDQKATKARFATAAVESSSGTY
jgi:hypothetical protein